MPDLIDAIIIMSVQSLPVKAGTRYGTAYDTVHAG